MGNDVNIEICRKCLELEKCEGVSPPGGGGYSHILYRTLGYGFRAVLVWNRVWFLPFFAFLVWNRAWLHIYGYSLSGSGLKRGIFWSEIGSGFWGPCGTPHPKFWGVPSRGFPQMRPHDISLVWLHDQIQLTVAAWLISIHTRGRLK